MALTSAYRAATVAGELVKVALLTALATCSALYIIFASANQGFPPSYVSCLRYNAIQLAFAAIQLENIDVEQSQLSIQELEEKLKNDQLIVSNKVSVASL